MPARTSDMLNGSHNWLLEGAAAPAFWTLDSECQLSPAQSVSVNRPQCKYPESGVRVSIPSNPSNLEPTVSALWISWIEALVFYSFVVSVTPLQKQVLSLTIVSDFRFESTNNLHHFTSCCILQSGRGSSLLLLDNVASTVDLCLPTVSYVCHSECTKSASTSSISCPHSTVNCHSHTLMPHP